jgi:acyl-CoA synthetase (AMP-forming)/AMP-acid ligase II
VIQLVGEDGEAVAADILAVMAGRLARFKIPSAIRLTPQELPHTATGKLLKRDLRGIYFPPAARAEDSSAR